MVITICSSVDFSPKIIELKAELEAMGHQVNIPFFTQKMIDGEMSYDDFILAKESSGSDIGLRQASGVDLLKRYWGFIKGSDAILVLNMEKRGIVGYIGGNTLMEMGYAYCMDKKIFLYNPIPERSERMHYIDEIIDMKPVVINGNIQLIK